MSATTATLLKNNGQLIPQLYKVSGDAFVPITASDLGGGDYGNNAVVWGKTSGGVYVPLQINVDGQLQIAGAAAIDAAIAGNPLLMGGRGSTATPTAVSADGDAQAIWLTRSGAVNAVLTGRNLTATTAAHTTLDVTTSTQAALAANASRKKALFINDSDTIIYLKLGAAAVANQGIRLNANGGSYEILPTDGYIFQGAVNAIHAGAGTKGLTILEEV